MTEMRGDIRWQADEALQPHEAGCLKLDSSKARNRLQWQPRWRLHTALRKTLEWHEAWRKRADMRAVTLEQLADYEADHQLQRQAS
jgi:CDP-glucose 4,6-dehydratase